MKFDKKGLHRFYKWWYKDQHKLINTRIWDINVRGTVIFTSDISEDIRRQISEEI